MPNTDPPVCADELGKRVGELEGEVRALRASVSRLQTAGKTVIAQRGNGRHGRWSPSRR